MKKRLFAMFLVLVMMTVAVAACGKSGNKESSKNKNGEETETVLCRTPDRVQERGGINGKDSKKI